MKSRLALEYRPVCRKAHDPTERLGEEQIPEHVERAHRLALHRIHQSAPIDQVGVAAAVGIVKARQQLRGHRQIRVEDREDVSRGVRKPEADGVCLAHPGLLEGLAVEPP